jgi:cytochrome c-type biogenesis protein
LETVDFPTAFIGGLIAFITPCVLPLVPVYLSILSGASFDQLMGKAALTDKEKRDIHRRVIANALAFIIGFSVIFIALGLVSQAVGVMLGRYAEILLRILGIVLILLGVNMAGIWKPAFLNTEARFQLQKGKFGLLSSFIVGALFAFGWTPCVGPILAPILALAAGSGSKLKGAALLATFSLGLGLPFFLSALSVNGLIAFTNRMKKHFHTMEVIVGSILIIVGIFLAALGLGGLDMIREKMGRWGEQTSKIESTFTGE